jgi:GTP-binding protein Era
MKKSAFTAIIGRPSSGKSTLLNALCGAKVAIVSPVPQTTRNCIRGIVNREQGQIVFVDTPGIHISNKKLNVRLKAASEGIIGDSDLILYLLDVKRPPGKEEAAIASIINALPVSVKTERLVVAINKIDEDNEDCSATEYFIREYLPFLVEDRVFKISALKNKGLDDMLNCLFNLAPEGNFYYDDDCYTDQDVNFRITEIIREKVMNFLHDELPHSIYVDIENIELNTESERGKLSVMAVIYTERESQKGIVIGSGAKMIKGIRIAALKDLRKIFDWKIELDIRVKTASDWRSDDAVLKRFL